MGAILDVLVQFFNEDGWNYHQLDDKSVLSMGFSGKNGKWVCYARAREEQEQFVFYSVCPVNVPVEKRQEIAEFITRANYGLVIGNFEMDFEDGEVRYKTSIDVEGDRLTPALVKHLVYANVMTTDQYLPGIMKVIYGNLSPYEAISQIEEG